MVSLVKDNMSKEFVVKFSSENGNSSRVKYKRRDVSAVRDLPSGCGPDVPRADVNRRETTETERVNVEVVDASVGTANIPQETIETERVNMEVVDALLDATKIPQETTETESNVLVETTKMVDEITRGFETGMQHLETSLPEISSEFSKERNNDDMDIVMELTKDDVDIPVNIIRSRNRYTPRKVSATRDYPLYCGANAPLPTEEDRARINSSSKDIAGYKMHRSSVSLRPYGPNASSNDMRNRVRDALRLFRATCQEILQGEEAARSRNGEQSKLKGKSVRRIDLTAAKIVKEKGKEVNADKQILGAVPGVEVGDEFQYRVELAIVGIHRLYQAGIDYMRYRDNDIVAVSIVASGGYDDELSSDVLIYSGQGGLSGKDKEPEDQKLERGNLALKNSIAKKNPVRVIRGSKESADARGKIAMTYVYDGLYIVERYWQEEGPHGKLVYKFLLRRMSGQP